jgi:hypothetical protein
MGTRKASGATALRASGLFCLSFGAAIACGPSLTSVHEGTVRFEHCNRLDLDEHAAKGDCKKCWSTWLNEYTYGQPRDRIDYARRRTRSLENGDATRPALKFDERNPEERQFYLVVPGPTSVRAPPPPVATVWKDGDGDAGALAKSSTDRPPAESCAEECRTTWKSCGAQCTNESGRRSPGREHGDESTVAATAGNHGAEKPKGPNASSASSNGCSTKCGSDYSSCMKHCFE